MAGNKLLNIIRDASQIPTGQSTDMLYGKVTSVNPLKVKIDNRFELSQSFLLLTSLVSNFDVKMSVEGQEKSYSVNLGLSVGEDVLLLRVQNGQKFIIIDRVR